MTGCPDRKKGRRGALFCLLGAFVGAGLPAALAQSKVHRIGFLISGSRTGSAAEAAVYAAFSEELRALGRPEGRNLGIEWRYGENKSEQLAAAAQELARLGCDVIVTRGPAANRAARDATPRIPIVTAPAGDPVAEKLTSSLARPDGNVTGLYTGAADYLDKHFDLMRSVVPGLARLGVLHNPLNPSHAPWLKTLQALAGRSGVGVLAVPAGGPPAFEGAMAAAAQGGAQALIIFGDTMFSQGAAALAGLSLRQRLPSVYAVGYAENGGLITYGPSLAAIMRRAAHFVDRILKGAKPAELPFEQPGQFDFVINLKTARSLGLTIPQSVLIRADKVIE